MKPKLVFIGGAPAIGKTTIARALFQRLPNSAWLDGDDVWRMNPFRVDDTTIAIVHSNIAFVLRNYLSGGFRYIILSWVLHLQSIIDRILQDLEGLEYDRFVFTLVCDEATLMARLGPDASANRRDLALARLRQCRALETPKIDTTGREPEDIVDQIVQAIDDS